MASDDDARELLEKLTAELYAKAAQEQVGHTGAEDSYLIAADRQFLGKITDNPLDQQSILNQYGPFGSQYSQTSIFNDYSPYGSEYGQFSVNNPYCTQPPRLFLGGRFAGVVSANEYVQNRIPTKAFIYALRHNLRSMLRGETPTEDEIEIRRTTEDVYIVAADGTFLGSLNPNNFDTSSIFNKFGPHGSKYSQMSIFNKYSPYGGRFSLLSPFNSANRNPPKVYQGGKQIAFLTTNSALAPRLDPNTILEWARSHVRKRFA